jgi:gamma-glutamyltranspeptidase/glutathione hydrolase
MAARPEKIPASASPPLHVNIVALYSHRKGAMAGFYLICVTILLGVGNGLAHAADDSAQAAIASAQPLATRAGMEILAAGGNAFDAAVAVSAALAVTEPAASGVGGGGFWLLHRASDGRDVMIDGRERAPLAAQRDMYLDKNGDVVPLLSVDGPLAAAIPGEPAALVHLALHYGRLPLAKSLAPAIRLARDGFSVDEHYRRMAKFRLQALRASPAAAKVFLKDDEVPAPGSLIKQPELAATLTALAEHGNDGFYGGKIAERLIKGIRAAGGIWTKEDLASYRAVERSPLNGEYRGLHITSAPPPSSGGVALLAMLNILSGYDLDKMDETTRTHAIVEAMRRAYRDRAEYLGDPDFVQVPVARLIDPLYAAGLRAGIRLDKATPSSALPDAASPEQGADTTHFSVLDNEGDRVAATLSVNFPFGSAFMPPGTGVLLNDEMDDFSAKPGAPNVYELVGGDANAIAPGKRPLSSMTPTFLEDDKKTVMLGTPGGSRIISMVLLAALNIAAGGDANSAVAVKRFHHQFLPDVIQYEPGALAPDVVAALQAQGYQLQDVGHSYGNMQLIWWDKLRRSALAASDPRGQGLALVK